MSNITLQLTGNEAATLYNATVNFTGPGKGGRYSFRKKMEAVWPELFEGGISQEDAAKKREVEITSEEQRGIAEGVLAFCNKSDTKDSQVDGLVMLSGALKIKKWLLGKLNEGSKPFEHSDDAAFSDED